MGGGVHQEGGGKSCAEGKSGGRTTTQKKQTKEGRWFHLHGDATQGKRGP